MTESSQIHGNKTARESRSEEWPAFSKTKPEKVGHPRYCQVVKGAPSAAPPAGDEFLEAGQMNSMAARSAFVAESEFFSLTGYTGVPGPSENGG